MNVERFGLLAAAIVVGLLPARSPSAAEPPGASAPAAASGKAAAAGPGGTAQIADTTFQAGSVAQGTDITHVFTIRNVGLHPLTVDAKPGCGCTVTEFDEVIAPGKSGKVSATIKTVTFKGPITKSITVTTNDPQRGRIVLQVSADVTVPYDVQPGDTLSFVGRYDALTPQEVMVVATDATPFDVLSATIGDASFKVAVEAAPESGLPERPRTGTVASGATRYTVRVTPPADPKVGMTVAQVALKTTLAKAADIPLRVFANVSGDVTFSPQTVMLQTGPEATDDQKEATVLIQKPAGQPLRIMGVTADDPSLTTETRTVQVGRNYEISVRYVGAPLTTMLNSKISVQTNDRRQPSIAIPVWGRSEDMPQGLVSAPPGSPAKGGAASPPAHDPQ